MLYVEEFGLTVMPVGFVILAVLVAVSIGNSRARW
jgi:hypothetical protein